MSTATRAEKTTTPAATAEKPRLILTHGEDRARKPLGKLIQQQYGIKAEYPNVGEVITI